MAVSMPVRAADGMRRLTTFVVLATVTIVVVRAYLAAMGYPQIGGRSNLHIAHALFGGAMMIVSLMVNWMFFGERSRRVSVVVSGVGAGLFLDEVGKFVTKTNDYFYQPAAEIMYLAVLAVIVGGNVVQVVRKPSARENLAAAGMGIVDARAFGVTGRRRSEIEALLGLAFEGGADGESVARMRADLATCPVRVRGVSVRFGEWRSKLLTHVASKRVVSVACWLMAVTALQVGLTSFVGVPWRPSELIFEAAGGERVDVMSNRMYVVLGSVTFVCTLIALVMRSSARTVGERIRALRLLRAAAVAFTVIGGVADFAEYGLAALLSLAVGVVTIGLISTELENCQDDSVANNK